MGITATRFSSGSRLIPNADLRKPLTGGTASSPNSASSTVPATSPRRRTRGLATHCLMVLVRIPDVASPKWSLTSRRSCARSAVEAYRFSGRFARHRSTIHRADAGNDGFSSCSGVGSLSRMAESV